MAFFSVLYGEMLFGTIGLKKYVYAKCASQRTTRRARTHAHNVFHGAPNVFLFVSRAVSNLAMCFIRSKYIHVS